MVDRGVNRRFVTTGMLQTLYRGLTQFGGPAIRYYLHRRRLAGKEDATRHGERLGQSSRPRPEGPLVWFHAASVGESLSVQSLIHRLLAADPTVHVLVTTGTVTSAQLMAQRLPPRACHQFVPVDRPAYVARFLDHWRPDLVLWIESEIWPNMLWEIGRRGLRAALINARMSERSARRWQRVPAFIAPLLGAFRLCLAQTIADAERLKRLGGRDVRAVGNLKFSAPPPPADPERLAALQAAIGNRPVWLLASSHPGENEIAAEVHARLSPRLPNLLTMIAPRHPQRAGAIYGMLKERGLTAARRSTGALPGAEDAVYLADTMGEMGLFYRVAPVVCVGGSFVPHGGQNPIEPAQLGCAVLFGPWMTNFAEVAAELASNAAAIPIADSTDLTATIDRLLTDPDACRRLAAAAERITFNHRRIVEAALSALRPLLVDARITPPDPEVPMDCAISETEGQGLCPRTPLEP